jgi:hypothetical protein
MVLALKKIGKLTVCVNYKALNKVIKKDHYPLPFCEIFLEEVAGHKMYKFRRWVQGLPPSENYSRGSIEDHIHHTMEHSVTQ